MSIKYCPLCERKVEPVKKFNWPVFIILLILGFVPGLLYFFYYLIKPKNRCPVCGTKNLQSTDKAAQNAMLQLEDKPKK